MSKRRDQVIKPFLQKQDYMNERIHEGIERNRKGYGAVKVVDAEGNPVAGAHVRLKQKSHDFSFGANIFMLDQLDGAEKNQMYKDLFRGAFNLATVPFYWNALEPEQGKPRFAADSSFYYRRPAPDICVDWCEKNGVTPKCHCLNYDQWTPLWVPHKVDEVKRLLDKRMREIAEHYAGRIPSFEVTNETLHPMKDGDDRCSTPFFRDPEFVEWSFETARRHFPNNELIINEATGHVWNEFQFNRSAYYMQIERALRKGASIDAVGFQYHMFVQKEVEAEAAAVRYDPERLYDVLDQYADFGKPMQITEVTIPAYEETVADEDLQAEVIKNLYSIWFSHPNMEAIIYWNLVDGYAYTAHNVQGQVRKDENYYLGGLIRHDFTPKPAYRVLQNLIHKVWHTEAETGTDLGGCAAFKGFYGKYDVEITVSGKTVTREIHFAKDGMKEIKVKI